MAPFTVVGVKIAVADVVGRTQAKRLSQHIPFAAPMSL